MSDSSDNHLLPSPSVEEVLVLYRRICLFQAQGKFSEATALEAGVFSGALETYRASPEGRDTGEDRLNFWLGSERKRVADVYVLAELLAPMLADRLAHSDAKAAHVASPAASIPFVSAPAAESKTPHTAPAPPAVAPSITDLLDGMLAQDRDDRHARNQRRAS